MFKQSGHHILLTLEGKNLRSCTHAVCFAFVGANCVRPRETAGLPYRDRVKPKHTMGRVTVYSADAESLLLCKGRWHFRKKMTEGL